MFADRNFVASNNCTLTGNCGKDLQAMAAKLVCVDAVRVQIAVSNGIKGVNQEQSNMHRH